MADADDGDEDAAEEDAAGDETDGEADARELATRPEVSLAERARRGAIVVQPEWQALLMHVTGRIRKWQDVHLVDDTLSAAEEEALVCSNFPAEGASEAELTVFFKRVGWRVLKRMQRRLEREKKLFVRTEPRERAAVEAQFDGDDDARELEARDARYEAALAGQRGVRGYKMLYARIIHGKSAEEVAAEFGVTVATYYRLTARFKARMMSMVAVSVVFILVLFGGALDSLRVPRETHEPVARHDEEPSLYERAYAVAGEADQACDLGAWAECLDLLDQAAAIDPTIRGETHLPVSKRSYEELRAAADANLHPPPVEEAPPPDDRKGPAPTDRRK